MAYERACEKLQPVRKYMKKYLCITKDAKTVTYCQSAIGTFQWLAMTTHGPLIPYILRLADQKLCDGLQALVGLTIF